MSNTVTIVLSVALDAAIVLAVMFYAFVLSGEIQNRVPTKDLREAYPPV